MWDLCDSYYHIMYALTLYIGIIIAKLETSQVNYAHTISGQAAETNQKFGGREI